MSASSRAAPSPVPWLAAQAFAFGAWAALLGIVANAMFLEMFGSTWLPATYVAIGVAGIVVSGTVARAAQHVDLLRLAVAVLGGAALLFVVAWAIAVAGGAWISAMLLVLFPILIQLGFVFIGGQAGRLLDIGAIKMSFPRILAGFPIGATVGGLLAVPLVAVLGRSEHLLLATAAAQGAFALLVLLTGRRHRAQLARDPAPRSDLDSTGAAAPSVRALFARRFVALILGYQVLSALGSQLADFLVYDRAAAWFASAEELAAFLAVYTAAMNVVSIVFLAAVAGLLLKRFGLRLGITANPLAITAFAAVMVVVTSLVGGASFALLVTVAAARITDIALTDGTTRTSINAMYQVLPEPVRLPAQATIEGIGVPVAIGLSGVLILVLNLLPFALDALIAATVVTCAVWTWTALLLYRAYGPALVDAVRRRTLLDPRAALELTAGDAQVGRRLLEAGDARATRLGVEVLAAAGSPAVAAEFAGLAADSRDEVRLPVLMALAASGDAAARSRLGDEVRRAGGSPDPEDRLRAATAMEFVDAGDRAAAAHLWRDGDSRVRSAALHGVRPGDEAALADALEALADSRTAGAAAIAVGALGDACVPALATALASSSVPAGIATARLVRASTTRSAGRDSVLCEHVPHRDRELGLAVLERLAAPEPADDATARVVDRVLRDDLRHARRVLGALASLEAEAAGESRTAADDAALRRALADELDLVRDRVVASRAVRHGMDRLRPAIDALAAGGPGTALALEALEVTLGSGEMRRLRPLLLEGPSAAQRRAGLADADGVDGEIGGDGPDEVARWLRDLVEDASEEWRSPWLRACAIRAAAARGLLAEWRLDAARALPDRIVDEELRAAGLPTDRA